MDFNGRRVTLDAPARRIVALAPHIVENLFSAGAGDALVGTVSYSDYPPQPAISPWWAVSTPTASKPSPALQPDLIVMWGSGNGAATLGKLEVLGIPVFVSEPRQLEDIPRDIRALGMLAGTWDTSEAEAAADRSRAGRIARTLRSAGAAQGALRNLE